MVGLIENLSLMMVVRRLGDGYTWYCAASSIQDGNCRTAQFTGSIFHEEYDDGWENNYGIVSTTRSRRYHEERGGFIINSYIHICPVKSQSNPEDVIAYLGSLLSSGIKTIGCILDLWSGATLSNCY